MPVTPDLTAAEIETLLYLVRWRVREYRDHPQYEDLLAEAYQCAWRCVVKAKETVSCKLSTAAVNGAWWGAVDFLRSPRNLSRTTTRVDGRHVPMARPVSLTDLAEGDEPRVAGVATAVEQRMTHASWRARVKGRLTVPEWQLFRAWFEEEATLFECRKRLGVTVAELALMRERVLLVSREEWEG